MAAWGPVDNVCIPSHPHGINSLHAEIKFAEGHVLILLAFLTGLVAYLTRGKGDMKAVLAEISGVLHEARAQIAAAKGTAIEWHFSSEKGLAAAKELFQDSNITKIKLVLTPKI